MTYKTLAPALLLGCLWTASCQNQQDAPADSVEQPAPSAFSTDNIRENSSLAVLYHQNAAEYRALAYQAFNLGRMRLDEMKREGTDLRGKAIVLDVDETLLDNSPYNARLIADNEKYTPATWSEWTAEAKADSIPGAVSFLTYADAEGMEIYYVSNRSVDDLEPTMRNMEALGFPQVDSTHYFLKEDTSDKEERRKAVREKSEIVLFFGDNLGDYMSIFDKQPTDKRYADADSLQADFGRKFILLPNAMYGTWEGAIYDYDRKLTDEEEFDVRMRTLRPDR
ncbi:5'-nucleotidase, lipoprotein e(P4) family [Roseivirga sp. BDSF3-8]|uniref:5'-nucleotidase, lipoprotein e(P4) family n=1 Tax=Roseivirga sp. BDSF3-8 TaxID=3241598 RepID=UPI0035327E17